MLSIKHEESVLFYGVATMNWDQIKSNWKQASDKIKVTWGKLSEDDLAAIAGNRDLLSGLLQERYGYAKVQADTKVDEFAQGLNPKDETQNAVGWIHHSP
jgi:uncharacterized protein YjbJ (UPF0337 family)